MHMKKKQVTPSTNLNSSLSPRLFHKLKRPTKVNSIRNGNYDGFGEIRLISS